MTGPCLETMLEYTEIVLACVAVAAIAAIADLLGGRRGYGGALLVAATGGLCGWFLIVRVMDLTTMNGWVWIACVAIASTLSLSGYTLFRSKR